MRIVFITLFLFVSIIASAQSISDLERSLSKATSVSEQMELKRTLAEKYMRSNTQKAARYSSEAYNLAKRQKNTAQMAAISYLEAEIQLKRKDSKRALSKFKTSLAHAKSANNTSLSLDCLNRMEDIAKKSRNYKQAYQYSEDAVALLKNSKPISQTPKPSKPKETASAPANTDRRPTGVSSNDENVKIIRKLKREKEALEKQLDNMEDKIDQLADDKISVKDLKNEIVSERKRSEEQLSKQEEAVEELRQKAIASIERKEKEIKELSRTALEQEAMNNVLRAEAAEAKMEAEQNKNFLYLLALAALFALALAAIIYTRFRSNKKRRKALEEKNKIIEDERKRSDELLLNILPAPIATELKENGKAKARKFNQVTVLFADFKNFTAASERLGPEQLVKEIDHCFKGFDYIISEYKGIEKIKTIGDAYMCAMGLTERTSLPNDIIKAAFDMQQFLKEYKEDKIKKNEPYFEARIGIHTGAVVAGVVGFTKFSYDIWGDTVNIAARMEANCEVGEVNISESTYDLVRYKFNCIPRGKVAAKNKGMINMYYAKSLN